MTGMKGSSCLEAELLGERVYVCAECCHGEERVKFLMGVELGVPVARLVAKEKLVTSKETLKSGFLSTCNGLEDLSSSFRGLKKTSPIINHKSCLSDPGLFFFSILLPVS